ncbi:VWA domain-containing protein [Aquabacterium sp. A08]|uniref:vWA domain-containing protein n=1 Tax=Aquabacterium sp. A08 TaxID=2718532 RepID=UPI0014225EE7|nr:VWA domain-containing protein [Aquabacterium sp. A08]NIC42808.1 VWA domain-containing protein [Aquabacterium sp. A08]
MPTACGPAHINRPYHHLGELPQPLWRWAVVCSSGPAVRRLPDLPAWRDALLQGRLPDPALDFGDPAATQPLRQVVGELALTDLTRDQPALAQQLLQSLLWHLDHLIDRPAGETRAQAIARTRDDFRDSWQLQRQGWEQVQALTHALGDLAHLRWDELQGLLQHRAWGDAQRIGERLAQMPALRQFIDRVGRRDPVPDAAPAPQAPAAAPQPSQTRPDDDQRAPEPTSVDGVRRSRVLARMTGAESAGLTHPLLRRLWRARFAEAQLLTYDDRAPQPRPAPGQAQPPQAAPRPGPPSGRGPLIVCLDTSGSMRGAPENVGKACVLQALRSAGAGQRPCRLLAFGGQGELLERELAPTAAGLAALLDTLGQGFDGGTDVQTPLERAVERVREDAWRQADVLIVSDGEFGVTPATLARLREAKATLGLRVHGLLIGDRETIGLLEVCDQLHWVRDWRRHGDQPARAGDGFSPVHSRSLTALYFPNAIRRDGADPAAPALPK